MREPWGLMAPPPATCLKVSRGLEEEMHFVPYVVGLRPDVSTLNCADSMMSTRWNLATIP